jgi:hypothetical protein
MLSHQALGPLKPAFQRGDTYLVILNAQDHFITHIDTKRLAKSSRYYDSAILIDTHPGFDLFCHITHNMTLS